jgi:hypothetical protein
MKTFRPLAYPVSLDKEDHNLEFLAFLDKEVPHLEDLDFRDLVMVVVVHQDRLHRLLLNNHSKLEVELAYLL